MSDDLRAILHTVTAANPSLAYTLYSDSLVLGRYQVTLNPDGTYRVLSALDNSEMVAFGAGERPELLYYLLERLT